MQVSKDLDFYLNPKDRVFVATPRPGTKQVWISDYWIGVSVYTYPDYVAVEDKPINSTPAKFELLKNYPNPFNAQTEIVFSLSKPEKVNLTIYNSLGQQVAQLINNELLQPGQHIVSLNSQHYNLPTGIYFYQLSTSQEVKVKKMLLVR